MSRLIDYIRDDNRKSALQKKDELIDQILRFENTFGENSRSVELAIDQLIEYEKAYAEEIWSEIQAERIRRKLKQQERNRRLARWAKKIVPNFAFSKERDNLIVTP